MIVLVLGCWGREEKGFCLCNSISNEILDLSKSSDRNSQILDILDARYKLFDRPLYKNIHTAIWNIQEKFSQVGDPVFTKEFFKCLEEFCIAHKKCGLYLRLELKE